MTKKSLKTLNTLTRLLCLLRILSLCLTGCIKVILFSFFKHTLKKSVYILINHTIRHCARKIMKIAQASCTLVIPEKYTAQHASDIPRIYMSNHASLMDLPLIYTLMPGSIFFAAKPGLFKIPLFGRAIQLANIISTAHQDLYQQIKNLFQQQPNTALWFFPEGHRSPDAKLLTFKAGGFTLARQLQAAIIPVALMGTHQLLPAHTFKLQRGVSTQIRLGTPILCKNYPHPEDQIKLIQDVRKKIQCLMQESQEYDER